MTREIYKVRVQHKDYGIFTIAEVEASNKAEAESEAKKHFEWVYKE